MHDASNPIARTSLLQKSPEGPKAFFGRRFSDEGVMDDIQIPHFFGGEGNQLRIPKPKKVNFGETKNQTTSLQQFQRDSDRCFLVPLTIQTSDCKSSQAVLRCFGKLCWEQTLTC